MKKTSKELMLIIKIFVLMHLKSIIFTSIISSNTGKSFYATSFDIYGLVPHLAILGILIFPAFLFANKNSFKYLIIINTLYSILLIADMWVYRGSGYLLESKYILFKEAFNSLGGKMFNPNIIDLLFLIDILIFIFIYFKQGNKLKFHRSIKISFLGIIMCLAIVFGWHYLFDTKKIAGNNVRFVQKDWQASWSTSSKVAYRSPLGHHVYEIYETINKIRPEIDEKDIKDIDEWLNWNNENLPNNEYYALAKNKNVVFLQVESLENFVINQEAYGQEITPNLNKIIKDGLYFNNIYEQNNAGNSIDMDMMAGSGVLPLGDSITFLTHPEVKYKSLPRLLEKDGYTTVLSHAERSGDWNFTQAGKMALGFGQIWDIGQYNIDEYVGFGLSDRSLYNQFAPKLSKLEKPFFATVCTLASHGPFDIKKDYRKLHLPKELDENKMGGYFQSIHYADEQIGHFLKLLEEEGLINDTIVVIYGDHGGIHKYYEDDVAAVDIPGEWWQENKRQIPFIVYGKGIPSKTITTTGGHIDIMPTVAYLLGVDTENLQMGRNLLNTKRDVSVIKGGIVVGNPTEEEKAKFEKAYDISDKIIKNNYYVNTKKIN